MSVFRTVQNDLPESGAQKSSRSVNRFVAVLWIAAIGIALWVAAAYLLPQHLRVTRPWYGLAVAASFVARVLQFHLAIALAVIACIALFLHRRRPAAFGGMLSAILLIPTFESLLPKSPPPPAGPTVRVMTINLLGTNRNADAILHQIRTANPDVIALEEYSPWADELLQRELAEYPYRELDPEPDSTGIAVYSKLPMSGKLQSPHNIMGTRVLIRATLQLDGRDVAFYAIHPSSPHRYENILRNRLQTADLLDEIKHERLPVIVAGDFNATETTANLSAYESAGFASTQDLAGIGRGSTWPDVTFLKYLPRFRIDHILVGPEFTCTNSRVCGPTGSDHRPVVADVGFRNAG